MLPKGTPSVVELKSAREDLKISVAEAMGTTAWGPWLERETKEAWEHSGVCACGRRTALFGQCMKCIAEDLSEDRASITPEAGCSWHRGVGRCYYRGLSDGAFPRRASDLAFEP